MEVNAARTEVKDGITYHWLRSVEHKTKKGPVEYLVPSMVIRPSACYKYPEIAEQIRKTIGNSTRDRLHEKNRLLIVERARNRELRAERDALFQEVRDLASENESLRRELTIQQAIAEGSVTRLPVPGGH